MSRAVGQSALIAGAVTAVGLIALPVQLLELGIASIGLSEMLPVLGPPIGWPVRIVLALTGAVLASGLSAGLGGDGGPRTKIISGDRTMGWKNFGLHHLARIARGEDIRTDQPVARPFRPELVVDADPLPRRREDMHPDAPPRAPLIASRDLPAVELAPVQLTVVETVSAPPPAAAPQTYVSPVRDTTNETRARPLPRSPEPLSETDINWVRDLLAQREAKIRPVTTDAPLPVSGPTLVNDSLMAMLDRFEQGVSQRIALNGSAIVAEIEGYYAETAPAPVAQPVQEDPLGAALDALKKLSAGAR